ncbi:translation initiation factor IF-2-like [Chiroxiphia lanceolata]|uniref:translation initiation factor IF-2-like n=1 Tax=Chiroxiphia lanceolata TaxID=296741 RepID=UPI0013CEB581|nr:translation initiation factor IF-2-like [Chiroxiphia lanceolata]
MTASYPAAAAAAALPARRGSQGSPQPPGSPAPLPALHRAGTARPGPALRAFAAGGPCPLPSRCGCGAAAPGSSRGTHRAGLRQRRRPCPPRRRALAVSPARAPRAAAVSTCARPRSASPLLAAPGLIFHWSAALVWGPLPPGRLVFCTALSPFPAISNLHALSFLRYRLILGEQGRGLPGRSFKPALNFALVAKWTLELQWPVVPEALAHDGVPLAASDPGAGSLSPRSQCEIGAPPDPGAGSVFPSIPGRGRCPPDPSAGSVLPSIPGWGRCPPDPSAGSVLPSIPGWGRCPPDPSAGSVSPRSRSGAPSGRADPAEAPWRPRPPARGRLAQRPPQGLARAVPRPGRVRAVREPGSGTPIGNTFSPVSCRTWAAPPWGTPGADVT